MAARSTAPHVNEARQAEHSRSRLRSDTPQAHVLRRRCACGGVTGPTGECEACRKKRLARLARRGAPSESAPGREPATPTSVTAVLNNPGQPLAAETRSAMESRFGHDFSRVRIHAGEAAARSARDVQATAWSLGNNIVFNTGAYDPATRMGRYVLAHELAHVVQSDRAGGINRTQEPPSIGPADAPEERDADRMAAQAMRGESAGAAIASHPGTLRRMVLVKPAALAGDMLGHFNKMCPGKFATQKSGSIAQIVGDCKTKDRGSSKSCECLCDTAHDKKRTYTISVAPAVASEKEETLHDGSKAKIPVSSIFPSTFVGEHPDITMPSEKGSSIEFGAFQPDGKPFWYENWRILAHELCGHGRLKQSGAKGEQTGCRAGHDATIDTENEIGAEHGSPKRGNFGDPRQGESFMNQTKKRGKVLFKQCAKGKKGGGTELHFEAP